MGIKVCSKCKQTKQFVDFYKRSNRKGGLSLQSRCKACISDDVKSPERAAYRREYESRPEVKARNAERRKTLAHKIVQLDGQLKNRYGISLDERNKMFADQGYKCSSCGATEPRGGKWDTDHCHDTGKVRGVICCSCNTGVGRFNHDPILLIKAAAYLIRNKGLSEDGVPSIGWNSLDECISSIGPI
jgi:hypothetical protein